MTTLAHTATVLAGATRAQVRRHTLLVSLTAIAVIVSVAFGFANGQADRAMTLLQSFLSGNRFSATDIEVLRILGVAFAPSIIGLVLAFVGSGLQDAAGSEPTTDAWTA